MKVRVALVQSTFHPVQAPRAFEIHDQAVCFFWPNHPLASAHAVTGWRVVGFCAEQQMGRRKRTSNRFRPSCGHAPQWRAPLLVQGVRRNAARKSCCGARWRFPVLCCGRATEDAALPHVPEAEPSTRYVFRVGIVARGESREVSAFSAWPSIAVSTCHSLHGEASDMGASCRGYFLGSAKAGYNALWLRSNFVTNVANITDVGQVDNICESSPMRTNRTCAGRCLFAKLRGEHAAGAGTAFHRCGDAGAKGYLRIPSGLKTKYVRGAMEDNPDANHTAQGYARVVVGGSLLIATTSMTSHPH